MRETSSQPSLLRRNSAVRTKRSPNPMPSSKAGLPSQISPPRWESASPYNEGDKRRSADGNRADRVLDKGVEFIHVIHSVVIFVWMNHSISFTALSQREGRFNRWPQLYADQTPGRLFPPSAGCCRSSQSSRRWKSRPSTLCGGAAGGTPATLLVRQR